LPEKRGERLAKNPSSLVDPAVASRKP
jgi:hypothetical protein